MVLLMSWSLSLSMPIPVLMCMWLARQPDKFKAILPVLQHREFNKLSFPGPPQHWLFGNIPDIAGKPVHQILYNWTLKFRGSFRVRFMNAKVGNTCEGSE
jgi:hypothetical protein